MTPIVDYPKPDLSSNYVIRKAVPIFAAYEEGKEKYDKAYLEDVAANCRKREQTGDLILVTLGHTDPGADIPETAQAPCVGYAKNCRVAKGRDGRDLIIADIYIQEEHFDAAKDFSRRSVELYTAERYIDVVALLRQAPRLDLGLLTAQKIRGNVYAVFKKSVAKYSTSGGSAVEDKALKEFVKTCVTEAFQEYAKHEKDDEPEEKEEECAPKSKKKKAHAEAAGVPGGDNTFLPGGSEDKKDHNRMAGEQAAIELNRLSQELATLRSENEVLRQDYRKQVRERDLVQLEAEGFVFDRSEELAHVLAMPDDNYKIHMQRARKLYQRSPYAKEQIPVVEEAPAIEGGLTRTKRDEIVNFALKNGYDFSRAMKEIK